jgi:hypothetical protein
MESTLAIISLSLAVFVVILVLGTNCNCEFESFSMTPYRSYHQSPTTVSGTPLVPYSTSKTYLPY